MPKKKSNKGRGSGSPLPAERSHSDSNEARLHKLESQSQELLLKVTKDRKAKWKPLSEQTINLVLKFIEQNQLSACEVLSTADKKIISKHIKKFTSRLEEVCTERLAPPQTTDTVTLRSTLKQHTASLDETQEHLKLLEMNISKLKKIITEKEDELAALER